jgi:hypothetical protein
MKDGWRGTSSRSRRCGIVTPIRRRPTNGVGNWCVICQRGRVAGRWLPVLGVKTAKIEEDQVVAEVSTAFLGGRSSKGERRELLLFGHPGPLKMACQGKNEIVHIGRNRSVAEKLPTKNIYTLSRHLASQFFTNEQRLRTYQSYRSYQSYQPYQSCSLAEEVAVPERLALLPGPVLIAKVDPVPQ